MTVDGKGYFSHLEKELEQATESCLAVSNFEERIEEVDTAPSAVFSLTATYRIRSVTAALLQVSCNIQEVEEKVLGIARLCTCTQLFAEYSWMVKLCGGNSVQYSWTAKLSGGSSVQYSWTYSWTVKLCGGSSVQYSWTVKSSGDSFVQYSWTGKAESLHSQLEEDHAALRERLTKLEQRDRDNMFAAEQGRTVPRRAHLSHMGTT
eukprot:gene739-1206_t